MSLFILLSLLQGTPALHAAPLSKSLCPLSMADSPRPSVTTLRSIDDFARLETVVKKAQHELDQKTTTGWATIGEEQVYGTVIPYPSRLMGQTIAGVKWGMSHNPKNPREVAVTTFVGEVTALELNGDVVSAKIGGQWHVISDSTHLRIWSGYSTKRDQRSYDSSKIHSDVRAIVGQDILFKDYHRARNAAHKEVRAATNNENWLSIPGYNEQSLRPQIADPEALIGKTIVTAVSYERRATVTWDGKSVSLPYGVVEVAYGKVKAIEYDDSHHLPHAILEGREDRLPIYDSVTRILADSP